MFSALRKLPSFARSNAIQRRNMYELIGPARQKLSLVEAWAHGLTMVAGVFAIPVWVLLHIKEYRGIDKKPEEGAE